VQQCKLNLSAYARGAQGERRQDKIVVAEIELCWPRLGVARPTAIVVGLNDTRELTARARFTRAGLDRPPRGPQKLDLIFDAAIDSSSKLAMLAMLHCSSHDGVRKVDLVKVSAATLGQMTGLHRVTAQKLVARLREYGILRRDPHGTGHVIAWDILAIGPAVGAASG
jgi:hypothetical protein